MDKFSFSSPLKSLPLIFVCMAIAACSDKESEHDSEQTEHQADQHTDGQSAHWSYDKQTGPSHWGSLNPDWQTCDSGQQQSPIDIQVAAAQQGADEKIYQPTLVEMKVRNQEHPANELDNGHTLQVDLTPGNSLRIGDETYHLKQFHFHSPSEHRIDGHSFAMETHFVHQSVDGQLAVVAVLGEIGKHNPSFEVLWKNLPAETGSHTDIDRGLGYMNWLLPEDTSSWRYRGSLTTPPCSENVRWVVLKKPVSFDLLQVGQFKRIFGKNNRPTQALNGRIIKTDAVNLTH